MDSYSVGTLRKDLGKQEIKELQKHLRDTGNSSIALSIIGFIISILLSLGEYSFSEIFFGALVVLVFLVPFYYFGKEIKDLGLSNLGRSHKIARGMLIYSVLFIIANFILGESAGILWFFLAYYYFRSYRETKKAISNSENSKEYFK